MGRSRRRRSDPVPPDDAAGTAGPDPDGTAAPEEDAPTPLPALDDDTARMLEQLNRRLVVKQNAEIHGLYQILGSKRRLFTVNFLAGLSRGVGFFLGATLVGGLVIGGLAFAIDNTMATLGYQDVTFKSLVRTFAKKAVEAQSVFEEVRSEQQDEQPKGARASEAQPPAEEPAGQSSGEGTGEPPGPQEGADGSGDGGH